KNCMNWANGGGGGDTLATNELGGAVGYMDSDNANTTGYAQVSYNGVWASRVAMHDGSYDNFWTVNRMYAPAGLPQPIVDFYGFVLTALENPANLTDHNLGSPRGEYYGTIGELNFPKPSSFNYPNQYSPVAAQNQANPN